jgi:hypothetical protein
MPLWRYQGDHYSYGVVNIVALAVCLATVWPLVIPFALYARGNGCGRTLRRQMATIRGDEPLEVISSTAGGDGLLSL